SAAVQGPLNLTRAATAPAAAPYFAETVRDRLESLFPDLDPAKDKLSIYTGLDLALQQRAAEAIRTGVGDNPSEVALVALDAGSGEVKALIGGRNWATDPTDRALSAQAAEGILKPFVFAAAL